MTKWLLVVWLVLTVTTFGAYWQKEGIKKFLASVEIVAPVVQQPPFYNLVDALEKEGLELSSLPVLENDTIYASISGIAVLFDVAKSFHYQARSLQLVLGKIKMEDKNIKEIDLRFNKVIIR